MATYAYKPLLWKSVGLKGDGMAEKASQTQKQGNLIKVDTANTNYYMAAAAADSTGLFVAGQNGDNLSAATGDLKPVYFVNNDDEVEITISGTPTAAQLKSGTQYGLGLDATTGYNFIDLANTTNLVFSIVRLVPGYVVGDTRPRVLAKVLSAARF